ncbi:MAG: hypothetical protein LLF95_00580 [Bacteroidales bacterium]|nr:hypothetical protein [Bacteroidales bacterium]
MKLTKSASPNAKNHIPERPKNRTPHKTGRMFYRRERGKVAGLQMRMVAIPSCEAVKSVREELIFRVILP